MKIRVSTLTLIAVLGMTVNVKAQTAAAWTFPGSVFPTSVGAQITASNTTMGSDVGSLGFSGSDFFGQDGWPSGAIDLNAYLQVTVSPGTGYYLVLNSISFSLRRSTTGTAAGSGPQSWSLRSSLDGYTSDLLTGTLNLSYQTFSISLPAAFQTLSNSVTFRIYGFNQVTSTGGSNRFVSNDITIKGQAIPGTLAEQSIALEAQTVSNGIKLNWQALGFSDETEFFLERGTDGADFNTIEQLTDPSLTDNTVSAKRVFYRVKAQSPDGSTYYSPIVAVTLAASAEPAIRSVFSQGNSVKGLLHLQDAAVYQLSIRAMDGKALYHQELSGQPGDATIDLAFGTRPHGVYVLTLAGNGIISSREFLY
jgi:hypothetical protein